MKIVADSCSDWTAEIKERLGVTLVPLTISLEDKTYIDDENLDVAKLMDHIQKSPTCATTAAPAPELFREAFEGEEEVFAITLSEAVSCTYQNAVIAKNEVDNNVHVFNSRSACGGETLIAMMIKDLIDNNESFQNIVSKVQEFIDNLKTVFVLDDISTVVKNGRMSKIMGTLVTTLGIKPILCADDEGNIAAAGKARGEKQIIKKLMEYIAKSEKSTAKERLVISHCQNISLAEKIRDAAKELYEFAEIIILPTGGISSVYANVGGVILAF